MNVADLAARQHGVVSRPQLLSAGWAPARIDREIAARRLHRVHRGVYAVGHRALSERGRWLAAVLACPDRAVLSHHSAAALWGLPISDNGFTRITTPNPVRRPRIAAHRATLHPRDRTVRHGIPVTTVARAVADLAHSLDDPSLHRLVKDAQFQRLWNEPAIEDALTRRPSSRLKPYLGDRTLTQTALEDKFLALCRRHGIPDPITQFGEHPRVDFHWPDASLIVEVDGYQAHGTRIASQADRTNTNTLLLRGHLVLRYTHEDITDRDAHVARQVLSAGNLSRIHSGPSSARRYGLPPTST